MRKHPQNTIKMQLDLAEPNLTVRTSEDPTLLL